MPFNLCKVALVLINLIFHFSIEMHNNNNSKDKARDQLREQAGSAAAKKSAGAAKDALNATG